MTDKLRGAFHGCPHHGDDYEACIQHSGTAPCDIGEERDRFSRMFANACETLGAVQEALGNEDAPETTGLEPEFVRQLKSERDAAEAKLAAIGKLSPTDYDDREALLGALFRILRGQLVAEEVDE